MGALRRSELDRRYKVVSDAVCFGLLQTGSEDRSLLFKFGTRARCLELEVGIQRCLKDLVRIAESSDGTPPNPLHQA